MSHRKHSIKPLPTFDKMQPIDPDEFITAVNWAQNAAVGKAITDNPTTKGFNWINPDGKISGFTFTDRPINRALLALHERYSEDTDKYASVAARFMALISIIHDPAIAKWMRKGKGAEYIEVHPAVIDAAAIVMLNTDGNFPLETFFSKVRELAGTKYEDEEI